MDNDFKIIIDGREIVVESATLLKTMDTGADAATAVMPWQPGLDADLDYITRPYSYSNVEIFIGVKLQMLGRLYNTEHKTDESGTTKELEIFSKTADIIDSTVIPPYEANNIGLFERCKQQCSEFGIEVIIDDDIQLFKKRSFAIRRMMSEREKRDYISKQLANFKGTIPVEPIKQEYLSAQDSLQKKIAGGYRVTVGRKTIYEEVRFPRVSAEQTDTIFAHLAKLASLRGYLLSCTAYGDLLITKAKTDSKPVGTIIEGDSLTSVYSAKFNGRNRFSMYRAIATSSRKNKTAKTGVAQDTVVPLARYLTFRAGASIPGQAGNAADWKKNKIAADSMPTNFPVNDIYAPNGELWKPNTTVDVISQTLSIKKGFTFLITRVKFNYVSSGITADLEIKPPSVYTKGDIKEPWLE